MRISESTESQGYEYIPDLAPSGYASSINIQTQRLTRTVFFHKINTQNPMVV